MQITEGKNNYHNVISPLGTLKYVDVAEANQFGNFSATLTLHGDDAKEFKKELDKLHKKGNKIVSAQKGKDFSIKTTPTKPEDDGGVSFVFNQSETKKNGERNDVVLADSAGNILGQDVKERLGRGSRVKLSLVAWPSQTGSTAEAGVTLRLTGIQIVDLIEYAGRSPFGEVEGGFVADDVEESFESADSNSVDDDDQIPF